MKKVVRKVVRKVLKRVVKKVEKKVVKKAVKKFAKKQNGNSKARRRRFNSTRWSSPSISGFPT